jgi:3-hydroxybutyryl-CoA dehydratase
MLAVRRKPAAFRIQGAVFIISNKYAKGTAMSEQNTNFEEFYGYKYEELTLGQSAVYARTVTEADILAFAGVSGDFNPVHINDELATASMFGGRIAHGMLSASFISTVFGMKLPGPGCIYLSQSLKFKAPVKIGDTVVTRCTIKELTPEKRKAKFDTVCTVKGKVVLEGEADIMVPAR